MFAKRLGRGDKDPTRTSKICPESVVGANTPMRLKLLIGSLLLWVKNPMKGSTHPQWRVRFTPRRELKKSWKLEIARLLQHRYEAKTQN